MRCSAALILVLLASGVARPALAAKQIDWDDCIQTKDADRGIAGCTRVVEAQDDPAYDLAVAFYNRGYAYSKKRDRDHAISDYGEAIRLNPNYSHAYANRGLAYFAKGDPDSAIADFNRALRSEFNFAPLYNARGRAFRVKGQFDLAIADYDEAIKLDPKLDLAYLNRGSAYRAKGDYDMAIADYGEAIRLDPKFTDAYSNRGVARLYGGALTAALADFGQASELEPQLPYAALWLDLANRRSGNPSRLREITEKTDMTKWPAPLVRLFLGESTPEAVLAAADDRDPFRKKTQVCQVDFFSGEYAFSQDRKDDALRLFRLAIRDCAPGSTEWVAARGELKAAGAEP